MTSDVDGGGELVEHPVWIPWTPEEVASRLSGSKARWYVVAGWAIDLFRGRQSRAHEDIEIGVPRADFAQIRSALSDYEFDVVGSGRRWPLSSAAYDTHFQTWLRERETGVYHLDVFRDSHDGPQWICRRHPRIRLPYDEVIRFTESGIPYMSPEIALLFKAKRRAEKDQFDFEGVLHLLDARQVAWLRTNLEMVHPNHPWTATLAHL